MIVFILILLGICHSVSASYLEISSGTSYGGAFTYTCSHFTGGTIADGIVTPQTLDGKFWGYMLDHDGTYSTKTSGTHTNFVGWNTNYDSSTLFRGDDQSTNEITWNMGPPVSSLEQCQTLCNAKEACKGVIYGSGLAATFSPDQKACQFMVQCKRRNNAHADFEVYMKTSWPGFTSPEVKPGGVCTNSPIYYMPVGTTPPTVPECNQVCAAQSGATHFEINHMLQCRCFNGCTFSESSSVEPVGKSDVPRRTTVYAMVGTPTPPTTPPPTPKPTPKPTAPPTTPKPTAPPTEESGGLSGGAVAVITVVIVIGIGIGATYIYRETVEEFVNKMLGKKRPGAFY